MYSANWTDSIVLSTFTSFGPAVWMRTTFFGACAAASRQHAAQAERDQGHERAEHRTSGTANP
jgi:hypothetical protein